MICIITKVIIYLALAGSMALSAFLFGSILVHALGIEHKFGFTHKTKKGVI